MESTRWKTEERPERRAHPAGDGAEWERSVGVLQRGADGAEGGALMLLQPLHTSTRYYLSASAVPSRTRRTPPFPQILQHYRTPPEAGFFCFVLFCRTSCWVRTMDVDLWSRPEVKTEKNPAVPPLATWGWTSLTHFMMPLIHIILKHFLLNGLTVVNLHSITL